MALYNKVQLQNNAVEYLRNKRVRLRLCGVFVLLCACHLFAQVQPSPTGSTFLIATDIHFNPMADASLVSDLAAADSTQWERTLERSRVRSFSQYGEDTNWWLLQSSLDAMRATLPHPAFIMVNGDILAHRFPATFLKITHDSDREDYRRFVLKTVEFVMLEFRRRFPDAAIFLTPGNNDEDCGNFSIDADGTFLHDTADLVRELAHGNGELRGSWETLGSYDIPHPTLGGVRIISLNSIFLGDRYRAAKFSEGCAPVPSTAARDVLAWLESRLSSAQRAHEKVWLMFHVPPGIDSYSTVLKYQALAKGNASMTKQLCTSTVVPMWAPEWTARFDALLKKYNGTVIASFAGHTHNDDFRLVNSSDVGPTMVLISPAISPIYDQDPAFRVVTFDKDGSLIDESVYRITNLNNAGSQSPGEWKREYRFTQEWKLKPLNVLILASLYREIRSVPADRDEWLKLYNTSSTAVHMPPNSGLAAYCAIEALDPETYSSCYCTLPSAPK